MAIPDWNESTGHLPPGRYRTSLTEIYDRFVAASAFRASSTREQVWGGFVSYMSAWRRIEEQLAPQLSGDRIALAVWLGGSFVSQKLDPSNLDLTVLVDGEVIASCQGKPGMGAITKLSHRAGMLARFKVSPCVVQYQYFRSPFRPQLIGNPKVEEYLMLRGAFDDWWQRARPDGEPKGEPTRESAAARRGYLEVEA